MRSISRSIARVSTPAMVRRPVARRSSTLRFGRLAGGHTINAFAVGLLRYQRQAELLAHHAGKEAADRVLLPAGRLHDGGDRCALGLSEQGEDGLLFGPAAGRSRGDCSAGFAGRFARLLGARKLGLCGGFAVRHFRILSVATASGRRHHRSPTVAASPAGQDPNEANRPLSRHGDSDAPFAAEVHSFLR